MPAQSLPALTGTSRQPHGSFAGKTEAIIPKGIVSVPALNGTSKAPFGSFAGKQEAEVPEVEVGNHYRGMYANTNRMMNH